MDAAGLTVPAVARCSCIIQSFVLIMHGLDYKILSCGQTGIYISYILLLMAVQKS